MHRCNYSKGLTAVLLVTALFRSILRLAQSCFKSYSLILTHPVNDNVKSHKEYYLNALSF